MWLYGILFLFYFQLVADFVAAVYAFGLLGTSIPPELVSVLLLLSPVVLCFRRKGLSRRALAWTGGLVLVAGVVEPLLDTRGRMLVSGVGMAAFLMLLPAVVWRASQREDETEATSLGAGLALGLALSVLCRAWNSGADPSVQWWYRIASWVLAAGAAVTLIRECGRSARSGNTPPPARPTGFFRIAGLSLGLVAALILLYFAFSSPNVIARWTGADYMLVVALVALALGVFAAAMSVMSQKLAWLGPGLVFAWNALFVASLIATIAVHQLKFPASPAGYPFYEPPVPALAYLPLALTCVLFPVILVDVILYSRELIIARPTIRSLGGGFLMAASFLLIMIFAQVFTTVYDYIPAIGPAFRDRFWAVFLVLGLVLALPVLLIRSKPAPSRDRLPKAVIAAVLVIELAAIAGAFVTAARPAVPAQEKLALRVLTYNIQQGYSAEGLENYDGQLALIRQVDPDIIGLQESDTNRISGGNSDIVRYFANHLDLYSYYGPKGVPGTFGIALLSKYPIKNPRTFYMYSTGEQTAAIVAQVTAGGKTFNLFVTHLGNGGPIAQQEAVVGELVGLPNVIAMGDFNFRPDSAQYRLTRAALDDAWLAKWPLGIDDRGLNPVDRIDHVFLTPGTVVKDARYLAEGPSDHPALVVEIGW